MDSITAYTTGNQMITMDYSEKLCHSKLEVLEKLVQTNQWQVV